MATGSACGFGVELTGFRERERDSVELLIQPVR
jgi:hypothetical protein